MEKAAFTARAQGEGYTEILDRELPAGHRNDEHGHPYDARLLIMAGEFTVTVGGAATTYRAGDVLEVPAGTAHAEAVGNAPMRCVIARRHRAG